MNSDKHIKIYIMLSSLLLIIVVVGIIIGFGHKARYKENNNDTKVESYTKGKEYTVDLIETNATVKFSTTLTNPLTGSKEEDVRSYSLYYDNKCNVYYMGYNSTYVPYLKDNGSWYKWNIEKGEIE